MKPCPRFLTAQPFLWWLRVFSAPRVGAGLGIPCIRCYLWCWEDAGKRVNPTSAFRALHSLLAAALVRRQSPEPAEYFLLNTRNPEHCKNYISRCQHCRSQRCLREPRHFSPSLPPPVWSHPAFLSPVFHLILYLVKELSWFLFWLVMLRSWSYGLRPVLEGQGGLSNSACKPCYRWQFVKREDKFLNSRDFSKHWRFESLGQITHVKNASSCFSLL